MIGLAVTVDGFFAGFSYGLRKISIKGLQLLHASAWTVPMAITAMLAAGLVKSLVPVHAVPMIGGLMLILAGALALLESFKSGQAGNVEDRVIRTGEAALLGLAVATDASVAAFSLGLLGASPYVVPFVFAGLHFTLIYLGNLLGKYGIFLMGNRRLRTVPGLILLTMGVWKLFA